MRTFIVAGFIVIAALAACGSDTSGTGGSDTTASKSSTTTGSGGSEGGCGSVWSTTNPGCSACMDNACCDELAACNTGSACDALVDCLRQCSAGNDSCQTACETSHADGKAGVDALLTCFDNSCKNDPACGTLVCDTGVSVSGQACGECLSINCCDSWKLCSQDNACLDCLVTADAACSTNGLYTAALACQATSCSPVCAKTICDTTLGYPDLPACNDCLGKLDAEGGCCEETQACADDSTCRACLTGKTTTGCSANAALADFDACRSKCSTECGG